MIKYIGDLLRRIPPLIWIVLLGAFLRLIFLDVIPNGFQQDEAAAGYDAYSMLKTLRTQHGQFLPLFAKTYEGKLNDYDESIYRFLIMPFIPLFGLNEFTTRLPAALVGTLDIVCFYYLVKAFFDRRIALIAAFLLAICPWHILISRIAFRSIIFNCLFSLSLFLFLRGLKQPKLLAISGLFFGLTLYTYSSARVFVPLFLLGLLWFYRQRWWRLRGYVIVGSICFALILGVLILHWTSPELMERTGASVCLECVLKNPLQYIVFYISYYFPGFLFFALPSSRTTVTGVGLLNLLGLVTIIPALRALFQERSPRANLIKFWLIIYPFPAFLTGAAYDLRATIGIPLFVMLSAYGLVLLEQRFRTRSTFIARNFRPGVLIFLAFSFAIFVYSYYVGYYFSPPTSFQHGLGTAIAYANNSSYKCTIVSDKFKRVNTMVLFYTQYPPEQYMTSPIQPYMTTDYRVGKFRVIRLSRAKNLNRRCLYILRPQEQGLLRRRGYQVQPIQTISSPDKTPRVVLATVSRDPAFPQSPSQSPLPQSPVSGGLKTSFAKAANPASSYGSY